jgi:hypothetical protein
VPPAEIALSMVNLVDFGALCWRWLITFMSALGLGCVITFGPRFETW